MVWVPVVVGLALLGFGRRLYWLFVGAIGFAIGLSLSTRLFDREPDATTLAIALVAGIAGALLALFVQRVAVVVAGFLAGAWLGAGLWTAFAAEPARLPWLPAIVGGVLGAALSSTLFHWVLIVLSSLVGAGLVAQYLPVSRAAQGVVFGVLTLVGIAAQAGLLKRAPPEKPRES